MKTSKSGKLISNSRELPPQTSKFVMYSEAEEAAYDIAAERNLQNPMGLFTSSINLVKGTLGSGILSGHVVYMRAGFAIGLLTTSILGFCIMYCLYILVCSAQIMYKRTKTHTMSYPDLGEAALALSGNVSAQKHANCFRYCIDSFIACDLFGACCCYQIIVSISIKQLVENIQTTSIKGKGPGYPPLQVYTAIIWIPCVLLCLINRFSLLAKISLVGNCIVVIYVCSILHYCAIFNPTLANLKPVGSVAGFFELCGVTMYSMSCAGVILPAENHLKNTYEYKNVHFTSYILIFLFTVLSSFFGYAAFLEASNTPITVNFPMGIYAKIMKVMIIIMVLATYALNFWIPFQLVWFYAKKRHLNSKYIWCWEILYKIVIVTGITILAILFPDVTAVMSFIGTVVLSNLVFVFPNIIEIYVYLPRPHYGPCHWRLFKCFGFIAFGFFTVLCGSYFTGRELVRIIEKVLH